MTPGRVYLSKHIKMKNLILKLSVLAIFAMGLFHSAYAQLPPVVPIWDANKVILGLHKIGSDIYAIIPEMAETETAKGIPQATTGGSSDPDPRTRSGCRLA